MNLGQRFKNGMEKLESTTKKIARKVPDKYEREADKKLGLFTIKYVATLLYWDKKVQNYMREYEEHIENDELDQALETGEKMKSYITMMAANYERDRRWQKNFPKAVEKIDEAAAKMDSLKFKASKLKDLLKLGKGMKADIPENLDEMQEQMKEEIEK